MMLRGFLSVRKDIEVLKLAWEFYLHGDGMELLPMLTKLVSIPLSGMNQCYGANVLLFEHSLNKLGI